MYRTLVCCDMSPACTTIDLLDGGHTDAPVALRVEGHGPENGLEGPRTISLTLPDPNDGPQYADDFACMPATITFGASACLAIETLIGNLAGGPTTLAIPLSDGTRRLTLNVRDSDTPGPHGITLEIDGVERSICDWYGRSPWLLQRALMLARLTGVQHPAA